MQHLLVLAVLAAVPLAAGCASNCGNSCPTTTFEAQSSNGESLSVNTATWTGPACPNAIPECRALDTSCQWFDIVGAAEGTCDLTITFTDGHPTFVAHAVFGPAVTQGCCKGFPVVGSAIVMIPPLGGFPDGGDGGDDGANMSVDGPGPGD